MTKEELIREGERLKEEENFSVMLRDYEAWCCRVQSFLKSEGETQEMVREIGVKMHYTENEYSKEETKRSVLKALDGVLCFLKEMNQSMESHISKTQAIVLIENILNNFHMFYRAMFQNEVHKKGTLKQETLETIKIENEYDLQRMLYALLLPIFPTARTEVNGDNGYGGMRADIWIDEYKFIIETKCTRDSMKEKTPQEELGADGFHYQADMIFFFVYDKNKIIQNPAAFEKAFMRKKDVDGKEIRMVIMRPRIF